MSYIIKITSDECPPRYLQRLNGWAPPSLTPASNLAKKMNLHEAEEALEKLKKAISREKGGEMVTAELAEVSSAEIESEPLIEDFPEPPKWAERLNFYGVRFLIAKKDRETLYRCAVGEEIKAQKHNGKAVAELFCRLVFKAICERIDAYEQRHSDL